MAIHSGIYAEVYIARQGRIFGRREDSHRLCYGFSRIGALDQPMKAVPVNTYLPRLNARRPKSAPIRAHQ
jgi:hypothetical protein